MRLDVYRGTTQIATLGFLNDLIPRGTEIAGAPGQGENDRRQVGRFRPGTGLGLGGALRVRLGVVALRLDAGSTRDAGLGLGGGL